jgi:hypothetical protein
LWWPEKGKTRIISIQRFSFIDVTKGHSITDQFQKGHRHDGSHGK